MGVGLVLRIWSADHVYGFMLYGQSKFPNAIDEIVFFKVVLLGVGLLVFRISLLITFKKHEKRSVLFLLGGDWPFQKKTFQRLT